METHSLEEHPAHARLRSASAAGKELFTKPPGAALVILCGRATATVIPVVVILLATDRATGWRLADTLAAQSLIWAFGAAAGFSIAGPTLTALGPRVAVARGVLIAMVLSGAAQNWFPFLHISFAMALCIAAAVFATSAWWETLAIERVQPVTRLLIVGSGSAAQALVDQIGEGRGFGYQVVGVVPDADGATPLERVPLLGPVRELERVIAESRPDIVVLTPGPNRSDTFDRLLEAAEAGFRVVELAQFYEHAYGRVPVEDLTRAWFMSVLHLYQRPYSRLTKRTLDVVGAFVLAVLTLPLFPVIAILVRLSSGPPILHRQVRMGEHGRLFTMYKFRTMCVDAEAQGEAVWAVDEDPRVTRVGSVARRLRLDELPQLWNVARGDMSLVGPRPERPEFALELTSQVPYWTRRHLVKPGITGWAQVRQGYTASAAATSEKLSYDLWYIRHRSLTVDIAILMRTLVVVLNGDRSRRIARPEDQREEASSLEDELVARVQRRS